MARAMHQLHPQTSVEEQHGKWSRELTLIDIADAFPHLPVHEKELEHTLTPDIEGDGFLLFRALLFGFRTAPLLWSRMAAWTSRMLQSCLPQEEAQHQTYLDDSLWALQGTHDGICCWGSYSTPCPPWASNFLLEKENEERP